MAVWWKVEVEWVFDGWGSNKHEPKYGTRAVLASSRERDARKHFAGEAAQNGRFVYLVKYEGGPNANGEVVDSNEEAVNSRIQDAYAGTQEGPEAGQGGQAAAV